MRLSCLAIYLMVIVVGASGSGDGRRSWSSALYNRWLHYVWRPLTRPRSGNHYSGGYTLPATSKVVPAYGLGEQGKGGPKGRELEPKGRELDQSSSQKSTGVQQMSTALQKSTGAQLDDGEVGVRISHSRSGKSRSERRAHEGGNVPQLRVAMPEKIKSNVPDLKSNVLDLKSNVLDLKSNVPELRSNTHELRSNGVPSPKGLMSSTRSGSPGGPESVGDSHSDPQSPAIYPSGEAEVSYSAFPLGAMAEMWYPEMCDYQIKVGERFDGQTSMHKALEYSRQTALRWWVKYFGLFKALMGSDSASTVKEEIDRLLMQVTSDDAVILLSEVNFDSARIAIALLIATPSRDVCKTLVPDRLQTLVAFARHYHQMITGGMLDGSLSRQSLSKANTAKSEISRVLDDLAQSISEV